MRDHLRFGLRDDDDDDGGGPVVLFDVPSTWRDEQLVLRELARWRFVVRRSVELPATVDLRSAPG